MHRRPDFLRNVPPDFVTTFMSENTGHDEKMQMLKTTVSVALTVDG